jgi:hypothetical protein
MLMQKLSRGEAVVPDGGQSIKGANFVNNPMSSAGAFTQVQPSNCVLLTNMFDPELVDLRKDPAFFIDIKE